MIRPLALLAIIFAATSCDKHNWKDTQVLHEHYSGHGAAHGDTHGAAKDAHGAKTETHGDAKPAEHGKDKEKH